MTIDESAELPHSSFFGAVAGTPTQRREDDLSLEGKVVTGAIQYFGGV